MAMTTMSAREFNRDTGRAKKAANEGAAFIIDRAEAAHVLSSIDDYLRLTGGHGSLADALAQAHAAGVDTIDFDPPRIKSGFKPADLS